MAAFTCCLSQGRAGAAGSASANRKTGALAKPSALAQATRLPHRMTSAWWSPSLIPERLQRNRSQAGLPTSDSVVRSAFPQHRMGPTHRRQRGRRAVACWN